MTFVYSLFHEAQVRIVIYNVAGLDVAVIDDHGYAIDNNKVEFPLNSLAPGVYFYVIKASYGAKTDSYKPGKFLVIK